MKTQLTIERDLLHCILRAVAEHMSTDETRYHLHGVLLEIDASRRVSFVATSGHTLALARPIVPVRDGVVNFGVGLDLGDDLNRRQRHELIIPAGDVKQLIKLIKPRRDERELYVVIDGLTECQADFAIYGAGGTVARYSVKGIDASFPPYERVIPAGDGQPAMVGISPVYFERIGKVARYFGGGAGSFVSRGMLIRGNGELDPVRVDTVLPDRGELIQVVMPMRTDGEGGGTVERERLETVAAIATGAA